MFSSLEGNCSSINGQSLQDFYDIREKSIEALLYHKKTSTNFSHDKAVLSIKSYGKRDYS
jgi:hypothetical protein